MKMHEEKRFFSSMYYNFLHLWEVILWLLFTSGPHYLWYGGGGGGDIPGPAGGQPHRRGRGLGHPRPVPAAAGGAGPRYAARPPPRQHHHAVLHGRRRHRGGESDLPAGSVHGRHLHLPPHAHQSADGECRNADVLLHPGPRGGGELSSLQ